MNRAIYSVMLILMASTMLVARVTAAPVVIDTTHSGWIWSGMSEYDDPAIASGKGRAGGPDSYAAYTISGTSVSIAMMQAPSISVDGRSHRMGKVKISIDGSTKAVARLYSDVASGNFIVYTAPA